jgi:hypothetical protein
VALWLQNNGDDARARLFQSRARRVQLKR